MLLSSHQQVTTTLLKVKSVSGYEIRFDGGAKHSTREYCNL